MGSLQVECVNSPLHFFQVKNAKSNLKQFSTSLKMLEMFAVELEPLRRFFAAGMTLFIFFLSSAPVYRRRKLVGWETRLVLIAQQTLNPALLFPLKVLSACMILITGKSVSSWACRYGAQSCLLHWSWTSLWSHYKMQIHSTLNRSKVQLPIGSEA